MRIWDVFCSWLKVLILFTVAVSSLARATVSPPEIQAQPGQPFLVHWADGREAALKVTTMTSAPLSATFQIIDNTCSNRQNMKCRYNFGYRLTWITFIWTKHPDPSRIGKIVEKNSVDSPEFKKLDHLVAARVGVLRQKFPQMSEGLPAQQFECDDFSWLPGGQSAAPEHLHIARWEGENNAMNPETGVSENRSMAGYMGIDLRRVSPRVLQFETVQFGVGDISLSDNVMAMSPQSLSLPKGNGRYCEVGLSADLRGELKQFIEPMRANRPKPAQAPTFIVGSSEILDQAFARFRVSYWFRPTVPEYR
jgi:hypothetical protein